MSTSKETTLWCDWKGETPSQDCMEWRQEATPRVSDARREARTRGGWSYRDGKDYCPEHAAAQPGKAPAVVGGLATMATAFESASDANVDGKDAT